MPLDGIHEVVHFDVWGIDFMRSFVPSNNNLYVPVVVGYVLKWVEAQAYPTNDAKVVIKFLKKKIFTRFRNPRAIIIDDGWVILLQQGF